MLKKLSYEDVVFKFDIEDVNIKSLDSQNFIQYKDIYKKFKNGINISNRNYNLFLIDKCTDEVVHGISKFIKENYKDKDVNDVVYINYESTSPRKVLILKAGIGQKLKNSIEHIKNMYVTLILQFLSHSSEGGRETFLMDYLNRRKEILKSLNEKCDERDFKLNYGETGFTFIPLKNGEKITEDEFEELSLSEKEKILEKLDYIKEESQQVLVELKENEEFYGEKLKNIFKEFLVKNIRETKDKYIELFKEDKGAYKFFISVCDNIEKYIIEEISFETDSYEEKIIKIISRYNVEVLVDHRDEEIPIIYEKNPTYKNLFGSIEYIASKNENELRGVDIEVGSVLKSRGGFLIIDVKELLRNNYSYEALKKVLKLGQFTFKKEESILSFLSQEKIKTDTIPMRLKVILIGEFKYYHLLYNNDEDFKDLFKIVMESKSLLKLNTETKEALLQNMLYICKKYRCKPLTNKAITEVARIFAKEGGYKDKISFNNEKLKDLMILGTSMAVEKGKKSIELEDIKRLSNEIGIIQSDMEEQFKENEILLNVQGSKIGEINGLSVIDLGHTRFGRPVRITCTCSKGKGNIFDVQRESNLSGKIHNKSLNILRGLFNTLVGSYNDMPVDFNISFEQIYGLIEGDSASVAEAMSMFSALLKFPIRQNIGVTGSINQIGEVQSVGGINEKIEGFYNVCKIKGCIDNGAVLIPHNNVNNIILTEEIEQDILKGKFNIYTMENIYDAFDILIENNGFRNRNILDDIQRELKRYSTKRERR